MNLHLILFLFLILFVMVCAWFALCKWLFSRLEKQHPKKYEEMGKPSLFLRNNISNGWSFMTFLFRSEYLPLEDPILTRTCKIMKIFFAIYLAIFLFLIASGPFFNIQQK